MAAPSIRPITNCTVAILAMYKATQLSACVASACLRERCAGNQTQRWQARVYPCAIQTLNFRSLISFSSVKCGNMQKGKKKKKKKKNKVA